MNKIHKMKNLKNKKIKIIIISAIALVLAFGFISSDVFSAHTCKCPCVSEAPGGLVPCGRYTNNPNTSWDERQPCNLCFFFLMLKLILEFLLKLALIIALLFIIISGLLYIFSLGSPEMLTKAKSALTQAIGGLAIIFLAWLVINTAMNVMGWTGGKWNEIDCPGGEISSFTFSCCGDKKIDKPNSCNCMEMCEPADNFEEFKRINASVVEDFDKSGEIDDGDYVTLQMLCTSNCTLGCVNDPKRNEVGLGCFLSDNPSSVDYCQRGRYFCDENTDTVICGDVFSPPIYDECCVNEGAALSSMDFDIIYLSSGTFNCDDVCKKYGKVCIGVGLMDSDKHYCKSVKHHESPFTTCDDGTRGKDCTNAINITGNDCRSTFVAGSSDCVNCYDIDSDGSTEPYWFKVAQPPSGGTACYCANR